MLLVSTRPMALSLFVLAFSHPCPPALASSRCMCVCYKYPGERGCSGDRDTQMFVAAFQLLGLPSKVWVSGTGLFVNLCLFPARHSHAAPGSPATWAAWAQSSCFSGCKPMFGPHLCYFSFSLEDLIHHPLSRSSIQST